MRRKDTGGLEKDSVTPHKGWMRHAVPLAAAAALTLAMPGAAEAHHSIEAQFDVGKTVTMNGVLTKLDWLNPHVWFHFDVRRKDGRIEKWAAETLGPYGLGQIGFKGRTDFTIGASYKFTLNPDRSGKIMGFARAIAMPDGTVVKLGIADPYEPGSSSSDDYD